MDLQLDPFYVINMKVNLISDTVSKPSKEMLDFMLNAQVGDDVFKEDPSVNELEFMIADMFGMDNALFFSLWYHD